MSLDEDNYELATRSDRPDLGEPPTTEQAENMACGRLNSDNMQHENDNNERLNRRTIRKLDLVLLPFLCTLFLLNSLDKSNVGNAETAGRWIRACLPPPI